MARGHDSWDEELCAKCDGTLEEWSTTPPLSARLQGPCSWCLLPTAHHRLRITNVLRRDGYGCENCEGRTAVCHGCQVAFTRCTSAYADVFCAKCDGSIEDWKVIHMSHFLVVFEKKEKK
jgi:hypothetical protein